MGENKSEYESIIHQTFAAAAANYEGLSKNLVVQKDLQKAAEVMIAKYRSGGSIFVCGNGGSAADSQHLVAELVSKLSRDRTPIRAFAMTTDSSILTAIGNDYGYDLVFDRQVRGLMRPVDVLLAITTSGNSPNILRALQSCREIGATSVLLCGFTGGKAKPLADHTIVAPGENTARIQESHLAIYHTLCHLIEVGLVESGHCRYL